MSREIKFKAWNTIAEHMTEPFTLQDAYKFVLEVSASFENTIHLQFIGRKANNGTDIYEGDIMKKHGAKYQIIYHESGFIFANLDGTLIETEGGFTTWLCGFDIIGNIYENPELLK